MRLWQSGAKAPQRRRTGRGLHLRLWQWQTLLVNGIVLLGFLSYGGIVALEQAEHSREWIAADARNLGRSIAAGSLNDLLTYSLDRIENRLLRQVTIASVRELLVADTAGRVLVGVARPCCKKAHVLFDESTIDVGASAREVYSDEAYTAVLPIGRGRAIGYVRITVSLERLQELRGQIWRDTMEIGVFVLLVLFTAQMLMLKRIAGAVDSSRKFAESLIDNLGATVDPHSRIREVASLKHSLNRVSMGLSAARSREMAIGQQIQQTLLVSELPSFRGALLFGAFNHASTGINGDFYEFVDHGAQGVDLMLGDPMGKGITAALIGLGVKQELSRILASAATGPDAPPPRVLANALQKRLFPSLSELNSFVTFALLRLDPDRRQVTFVDAGHTKAILASQGGTRLLAGDNVPLGFLENERYAEHHRDWNPGDLLLLYSDGLTEAMCERGEMFGPERLSAIAERLGSQCVPANVVVQAVRREVSRFVATRADVTDDSTCIAVLFERNDDSGNSPVHIESKWDLATLSDIRDTVEGVAKAAALDTEATQALVLAVSETASNIIRHVNPALNDALFDCRIERRANGVDLAFHYVGASFALPVPDPDFTGNTLGGFGLFIVEQSVDEVCYEDLGFGVQRICMRKTGQCGP